MGIELTSSRASGENWRPRVSCDQCRHTTIRQSALVAWDADQLHESRYIVKRALPLTVCGWACYDKLRADYPEGGRRTMSFRDLVAALAADVLPSTAADPRMNAACASC